MAVRGTRSVRAASAALFISVLALAWAVLVWAAGGFDATIAGLRIRTHDVIRPLVVSVAAFAVFLRLAGFRRPIVPHQSIVAALAVAVFMYGAGWATCAATGADAYGYLSQARLWLDGLPVVPQPWVSEAPWPLADWTFTPIGYRPIDGPAIAPAYAVGLPLLMAAVDAAAGYRAVFWIVPAAGALLVAMTYALARRLSSSRVGLTAAFLVATNATLLGEVTVPMSDIVLSAALTTACWFLFRREGPAWFGAAIACALAVLVRPNLAPTVVMLAVWLAVRPALGDAAGWRTALTHAGLFVATALPGFLVPAWANWQFFGSPLESGYGGLGTIYDATRMPSNLAAYVQHIVDSRAELALVGFAALFVPWRGTDRSIRVAIGLFVGSIVLQYLAYEHPGSRGYLRFLLPCLPLAMIGFAQLAWYASRPGWPALLITAIVVAAGARGIYAMAREGGFDLRIERKYAGAAALTAAHTEVDSVVLSMQHSGSVRYYGGRMSLRYDWLNEAWLDRSVEWLAGRGHHVYALLDAWKVEVVRQRFEGQARAAHFETPIAIYRGTGFVYLFDLTRRLSDRPATVTIVDTFENRTCVPPFPAALFRL